MILDKPSRGQRTGDRGQGIRRRAQSAERRAQSAADTQAAQALNLAEQRRSQFSIFNFQFSLRHRWVRLILLILAIGALSLIGSALGRGFGSGPTVVGQAVSPTVAVVPILARPASAPIPTAMVAPTVAAAPVPAPAASQPANVEDSWPLLAEERFEGLTERWPEVRSSRSWSSSYQDGGYLVQVDSRPGISYSGPLRSRDFWYGADVRITRGQAGLFFLIGRPNDFYRLLIDTAGRYQLEWQQVGVSQPLIAWTASDALRRGEDQLNRIGVRRSGDALALYANGTLLASYSLPPGNMLESRIGLALDAPGDGRAGLAWFDNLVVRAPEPS